MTTKEYLINGLIAETGGDGISITGNTFPYKEFLKSLGGKWSPSQKAWILSLDADLSQLRPPPQPRYLPLPKHAIRGGKCCSRAKAELDKENPQGPLWYICPVHGTYKSCYTGD